MEPVPRPGSRPTIRDVARRAGVGVATVSRVLNDHPAVSGATHRRVRAAIDELGYRPSRRARGLSMGRAHAVGVVAPFFTSPSVVERLRGVAAILADRGYDLLLFDVETPKQRADAFTSFARPDRLDGLLVISLTVSDDEVGALERDGVPVLTVDAVHPGVPHVAIDDVRGGVLAAEHLLARGHRRIGFIGDDAVNAFGFTSSEDRRKGFRQALTRAGIARTPALERRGRHGRAEARALAVTVLGRRQPPTAIFAASDVQAIGVLEAAAALQLRVPEDVAVIGFDDIELAAVLGLTTVRQPLLESGRRGAELLLAAIEGGEAPVSELEPLTVVVRRTT